MKNLKWLFLVVFSTLVTADRHPDTDKALQEYLEHYSNNIPKTVICRLQPSTPGCLQLGNYGGREILSKVFNGDKVEKLEVDKPKRHCKPPPGSFWCTGKRDSMGDGETPLMDGKNM